MTILNAVVLGIVEGLTEFLPISSTAHLIFISKLLKIPQTDFQKFFEVFIQSGAILAVLIIYLQILVKRKNYFKNILISFVPTAVIGFILYKIIKKIFFESYLLIISMMLIVGILFLIVEKLVKNKSLKLSKATNQISINEALLIGLGQSMAVVPGVSRAGAVIITMMFLGFKRDESAIYSFLLAVPTIFAASGLDLLKTNFNLIFNSQNLLLLIIGFFTSFISAFVVVRWFIKYLQRNSLVVFGWYRIIVCIMLILLGSIK
jgi:undecaprenyl-diphosphatase